MALPSPSPTLKPRLLARAQRVVDVVDTDLLVRDVTTPPRKPQAQIALTFERIDDAQTLDRIPAPRHLADEAKAFLARGDVGFAALTETGDYAGWAWLSHTTHKDPWSGLTISLNEDEGYAYALWVEPPYRPKGVARALMATLLTVAHQRPGTSRVYGWVDKRNRESQMLLRLLGFKDVQHVKRVMVLDRRGWRLPRTDRPNFGPLSSDGRHRLTLTHGGTT